jgi:hypothetical protein
MKTTKTFDAMITTLTAGGPVTNQQVNHMFKTLNGSNVELKKAVKNVFNAEGFEGAKLTDEQSLKGFNWLKNLWVTPTGKERINNPFGYREQDALKEFDRCELSGYYDAGNAYHSFYVPIYDVYSKIGYGFNYYVSGGQINIIG